MLMSAIQPHGLKFLFLSISGFNNSTLQDICAIYHLNIADLKINAVKSANEMVKNERALKKEKIEGNVWSSGYNEQTGKSNGKLKTKSKGKVNGPLGHRIRFWEAGFRIRIKNWNQRDQRCRNGTGKGKVMCHIVTQQWFWNHASENDQGQSSSSRPVYNIWEALNNQAIQNMQPDWHRGFQDLRPVGQQQPYFQSQASTSNYGSASSALHHPLNCHRLKINHSDPMLRAKASMQTLPILLVPRLPQHLQEPYRSGQVTSSTVTCPSHTASRSFRASGYSQWRILGQNKVTYIWSHSAYKVTSRSWLQRTMSTRS